MISINDFFIGSFDIAAVYNLYLVHTEERTRRTEINLINLCCKQSKLLKILYMLAILKPSSLMRLLTS